MATIQFIKQQDSLNLSSYSRKVLQDIMKKSGVSKVIITSTARTPAEQARIMYENIVKYGVDDQKKLYGGYGDKVIDVYAEYKDKNKSRSDIITAMQNKIVLLGPGKVSSHVADFKKLNVVDIAPGSMPTISQKRFEKTVETDSRIGRFFKPPKDPAYHLEIIQ